jgi:hypothetical protein
VITLIGTPPGCAAGLTWERLTAPESYRTFRGPNLPAATRNPFLNVGNVAVRNCSFPNRCWAPPAPKVAEPPEPRGAYGEAQVHIRRAEVRDTAPCCAAPESRRLQVSQRAGVDQLVDPLVVEVRCRDQFVVMRTSCVSRACRRRLHR